LHTLSTWLDVCYSSGRLCTCVDCPATLDWMLACGSTDLNVLIRDRPNQTPLVARKEMQKNGVCDNKLGFRNTGIGCLVHQSCSIRIRVKCMSNLWICKRCHVGQQNLKIHFGFLNLLSGTPQRSVWSKNGLVMHHFYKI
jgi:hypothetical protein